MNELNNINYDISFSDGVVTFKNINTTSIFKFNSSVDGISGATISVNSLKKDVFKLSNVLKKK